MALLVRPSMLCIFCGESGPIQCIVEGCGDWTLWWNTVARTKRDVIWVRFLQRHRGLSQIWDHPIFPVGGAEGSRPIKPFGIGECWWLISPKTWRWRIMACTTVLGEANLWSDPITRPLFGVLLIPLGMERSYISPILWNHGNLSCRTYWQKMVRVWCCIWWEGLRTWLSLAIAIMVSRDQREKNGYTLAIPQNLVRHFSDFVELFCQVFWSCFGFEMVWGMRVSAPQIIAIVIKLDWTQIWIH